MRESWLSFLYNVQYVDLNEAFVAAFEIAHYQRFKRINSSQQRSCIIDFFNFLDWKQRLTWYNFSSNSLLILHYQIWLTHLKVSSIYDYECLHFHSVAVQKSDSRCFFIVNVLKLLKAVEWFIILWQIVHEILNNSSTIEVNCIKWFHILNCLSSLTFLNQSKLTIFFWVLF